MNWWVSGGVEKRSRKMHEPWKTSQEYEIINDLKTGNENFVYCLEIINDFIDSFLNVRG